MQGGQARVANAWHVKMSAQAGELTPLLPAGNMAHLLNHSCAPNCVSRNHTIMDPSSGEPRDHVIISALRDILPAEELTYDYRCQPRLCVCVCVCVCVCGAACVSKIGTYSSLLADFSHTSRKLSAAQQLMLRCAAVLGDPVRLHSYLPHVSRFNSKKQLPCNCGAPSTEAGSTGTAGTWTAC